MQIKLCHIGKRFNRDWIFRDVNCHFQKGKAYAILGANGSGKSTLLQLISGFQSPTEGKIEFRDAETIENDDVYKHVAFAAPYLEIYESFTIPEIVKFQSKLKPFSIEFQNLFDLLELPLRKKIDTFSSGMKQKLKLGLAIHSKVSLLLLDEPTINLDAKTKQWYKQQVENVKKGKLLIVSSNFEEIEYEFADELIQIKNFKASNPIK